MIDGDSLGYKEVVDKKDDDEQEEEEQELCYRTRPRWELPQCDQVLKVAKLIIAYTYTLSVLSDYRSRCCMSN